MSGLSPRVWPGLSSSVTWVSAFLSFSSVHCHLLHEGSWLKQLMRMMGHKAREKCEQGEYNCSLCSRARTLQTLFLIRNAHRIPFYLFWSFMYFLILVLECKLHENKYGFLVCVVFCLLTFYCVAATVSN